MATPVSNPTENFSLTSKPKTDPLKLHVPLFHPLTLSSRSNMSNL